MANEEQLSILKQGVYVWNKWRAENADFAGVDLTGANLEGVDLEDIDLLAADLEGANLRRSQLSGADLGIANFSQADLSMAELSGTDLTGANLEEALLRDAYLFHCNLTTANLSETNFTRASLVGANLRGAHLKGTIFSKADFGDTIFGNLDLTLAVGLDEAAHSGPSSISTDTFILSKGKIPTAFLRGCGLNDWELEQVKLYNPDLSNEEIDDIQYKLHDLRATQALQISPLFISYSHGDSEFIDKLGTQLNERGIRFWRDIYEMRAGRIETQIDRAISQNRTVLLVLSENSLRSDWVEHEVRTARELEKEMGRDVLCPVALDDSWKDSRWPKRVMEQIMEYNILDFSAWKDDSKFDGMFRRLIDGLELFYKG